MSYQDDLAIIREADSLLFLSIKNLLPSSHFFKYLSLKR